MDIINSKLNTAIAGTAYSYSDPINLSRSSYHGSDIYIKCDVISGEATASFDINAVWSQTSGGTYAAFITGSGSSKIIAGGTSGALYVDGSYLVPLTIVPYSGVTELFKASGWLKLGSKSTGGDFNINTSVIL